MSTAVPKPSSPTSASTLKWILLAAGLATLILAGRQAGAAIPQFASWVDSLGAVGPLVFIVGYALAVVAFVPASILTLAAGAIFGLGAGVFYVFCAATLGSALAFVVARYLARDAVERRITGNAQLAALDRAVAADGRRIVFLLRLSPAFPFTLLNYALGLTRVRLADYLLASFGMLPGTLLFVYYGKLAGDVAALASGTEVEKGAGYFGVLGLGLVATIAVTAIVTRTARRALAEANASLENTATPPPTLGVSSQAAPNNNAAFARQAFEPSVLTPMDENNRRLLDHVRPTTWQNPEPAKVYDLLVVGAGTGGLICAAVAAGLGAKVALIERNLMGGDCLNFGCVPSKALLHHAHRVADARRLLGSETFDEATLDREFSSAMERMRRIRADISQDDSAARYQSELGVDVFQGSAKFAGATSVQVGNETLHFRKAVIASGARADVPPIPGLAGANYLTNETVFNLTERPRSLVVLGGGPIGCELAQAMQRLGCQVTLVDRDARLLPREDGDAAALVQARLERDGVKMVLAADVSSVESSATDTTLRMRHAGVDMALVCDQLLVAAGRRANVEGMDLNAANIRSSARGIEVDDNLRTSNSRVFAVGDCCMRWQFTHAADAAAKIVVQNALFFGRKKLSALLMPWCTYTQPEVAHVGLYEAEVRESGVNPVVFTVPMEKVNRAVCDEETDGFVRVVTAEGSDRILGATIVASHAGEMISEVSLAIVGNLGLSRVASVVHPYPTQAEGIKAAANAYMRTKLTPTAKKALGFLLRLQR